MKITHLLRMAVLLIGAGAALASCATTAPQDSAYAPHDAKFDAFFKALETEAKAKGLDASLLRKAYPAAPAPLASVAKASANQPEFTRTFDAYVGQMLSSVRIARGQELLAQHATELDKVATETGVPQGVMVALWGIESNYGKNQGSTPIIPALVSLAYQSNRAAYFKNELFAALTLAQREGLNPQEWRGSWAGASGQCQFMPSNILRNGRDGNGDGHVDIWQLRGENGEADVFASTASLLLHKGWQAGQPWRILAPEGLLLNGVKINDRGLSDPLPAAQWEKRGLAQTHYKPTDKLRYYQPQAGGPAWMVGPNFQAILNWNNSSYFAFSALSLADTLQQESK